MSDANGVTRVGLAAGLWDVRIGHIGRRTVSLEAIRVEPGDTVDLGTVGLDYAPLELDEVVVSVMPGSETERRIEAPSRVEVVGEREIEDRISASPADHLRGVASVDVIQYGVQATNVVVRGFNNVFSDALHALTDHRLVGLPGLGVNLLHFLPATDLDVQRMEVVLGPGSALYGPNTADGVLHVVTRSPLAHQGTTLSVAGGDRSFLKGAFRSSHLLGDDLGIKISGQWLQADEWEYTDPVEASNRASATADPEEFIREIEARGFDRETAELALAQVGRRDFDIERWGVEARADWRFDDSGTLVLTAGRTGTAGIEATGLGADQVVDYQYSFAQARVSRGPLFAQTYGLFGNAGESFLLRDGLPLVENSRMWVSQIQYASRIGDRQRFTYGVDYRRTEPRSEGTVYGIYEDRDLVDEWGGYVQSETALSDRLDLVLSGRIDRHSELSDAIFSPRAAVVFKPDDRQSFRFAYNRAFSTPSPVGLFLDTSAGRAPEPLGSLGYRLRALGTGADGFTFVRPDGTLAGMRSPFNPNGAGQLLPADVSVMWPLAVGAAASIGQAQGQPFDPALLALLQSLAPGANDLGISVLDPNTGQMAPLANTTIGNVPGLGESTTTTFEVGYEGVLAGRFRFAADVWASRRRDFISPLVLRTPLLLLDGESVGGFVAGPWVEARVGELVSGGASPEDALAQAQAEAAVVVPAIAGAIASVPVGVVSADQIQASAAELLVTYVNVGEVDLWGGDLGAEWLIDDTWSAGASISFVSDDFFEIDDGAPIALNAPKTRGALTLLYRDSGLSLEGRFRFASGFPVQSAELVGTSCVTGDATGIFEEEGCVDAMRLVDVTGGWSIPGTSARLQVSVTDLFDSGYRGFVGVPEIGRFALVGVRWEM
jgi:iron complex outermembrane receptor protein